MTFDVALFNVWQVSAGCRYHKDPRTHVALVDPKYQQLPYVTRCRSADN